MSVLHLYVVLSLSVSYSSDLHYSYIAYDPCLHQYVFIFSCSTFRDKQFHNVAMIIPAAYHSARTSLIPVPSNPTEAITLVSDPLLSDLDEKGQAGLLIISRGTALLLLGVYVAYLFFQVSLLHLREKLYRFVLNNVISLLIS